jgi:peptide/nickel transport system permease protein
MLRYVTTRMAHSAVSLVCLLIFVFFVARLTGDPSALYLPIDATPEMRREFAALHGFDQPMIVQFWNFASGIAVLDFGRSIWLERPALTVVLDAFPTTLTLAFFTMLFALTVGIVAGALAAWRPGSIFDRFASLLGLVGASVPSFWVALVGILVFAVGLRLLPTSGMGGPQYWVLPIAVLCLRPCGLIVQVVRASMISALSSVYVKAARAKGVPPKSIIFVHALRNALLPVITVAGDEAASIVNGAVIVETIFGLSGVGKLLMDAIYYRDFALLQAAVLVTAIAIFTMNILIDVGYALLDPRIRHS